MSNNTFEAICAQRLSRREWLATLSVAAAMCITADGKAEESGPNFVSLRPVPAKGPDADTLVVADQHQAQVLLRWGDPLHTSSPAFDPDRQTPATQEQQVGYNCDFVGFLPIPRGSSNSNHGLLVVNHEYTDPELMFTGYSVILPNPTAEQANTEMAAHGLSVVEIRRHDNGEWVVVRDSKFNRRITAMTPMRVTGPAAGHDLMKTTDDPTGTLVLGTLNNCSGGKTPWGTVLSGEENFHGYFSHLNMLPPNDPRSKGHERYAIPGRASQHRWERFHRRFDVSLEPNEPHRFGWVIEVDPFDPGSMPKKRTALGRFRHEAATFALGKKGEAVFYTGDDERFECVYKFVSAGTYDPAHRERNLDLLDNGTLYVARFNADGTGEWLPLVFGHGPLTPANGFGSQAEVLINTRLAADAVGATKMDRPEDIETSPTTGKVYVVLTNNTLRGNENKPGPDKANPRAQNRHGHIIEVLPTGGDHAATTFKWELLLVCGEPSDPSTYFAGFPKDRVSPISCPDNITFDHAGNLWIATDGAPKTLKTNDGLFAMPVAGSKRGELKQFLSAPAASEVCGPEFTPDNTTLFVAIQHPGEGGTREKPTSHWPDGGQAIPRPSVVAIRRVGGGPVGT